MDENNREGGQEDFSKLSLTEKLAHKIWRARKFGCDELCSILTEAREGDPCYNNLRELLIKIPQDTNLSVLESGLKAILLYVQKTPFSGRFRSQVLPAVVSKHLWSTRRSIRDLCLELVLIFVELDSDAAAVLEILFSELGHKNPKVVAFTLSTIREVLVAFGSSVVDTQAILCNCIKCFDNKDQVCRKEAASLLIEVYKWSPHCVERAIEGLKSVQVKELRESFFALTEEKPVPKRILRCEVETLNSKNEERDEADQDKIGCDEEEDIIIDHYENAQAVSLITNPVFIELLEKLEDPSWSVKKSTLDALLPFFKVMKIENENFLKVVSLLKKKLVDTNVLVSVAAINCIDALCLGLRSNFFQYRPVILPVAIEKLREKRKVVVDALRSLLDSLFLVSEDMKGILENIQEGFAHKNPNVRAEISLWVARCIKVQRQPMSNSVITALTESSLKAINDSDKIVRENSAELLATIVKATNGNIKIIESKVDKQRMIKIYEFLEKVEVGVPNKYFSEDYLLERGYSLERKTSLKGSSPPLEKSSVKTPKSSPVKAKVTISAGDENSPSETPQDNPGSSSSKVVNNIANNTENDVKSEVVQTQTNNIAVYPLRTFSLIQKEARTSTKLGFKNINIYKIAEICSSYVHEVLNENICSLLTYKVFNKTVEANIIIAIDMLQEPIQNISESISEAANKYSISEHDVEKSYIACSDVLFTVAVSLFGLRCYNVTMRCNLLIQNLLCLMDDKRVNLTEYEAKILSHFLLTQIKCKDHNMDSMASALFRKVSRLYPILSLIEYIGEILQVNTDSELLCLEEIINLIRRDTVSCRQPEKILLATARFSNCENREIYAKFVALIEIIYDEIGDNIFGYANNISEKFGAFTAQILKKNSIRESSGGEYMEIFQSTECNSPSNLPSPQSITGAETQHAVLSQTKSPQERLDVIELESEKSKDSNSKISTKNGPEPPKIAIMSPLVYHQAYNPMSPEKLSKVSHDIQFIVAQLTLRDHTCKIQALKKLEKMICEDPNVILLRENVQLLTLSLIYELRCAVAYILKDEGGISRLCKHIINILAKIFCCEAVRGLEEDSLKKTFIGILDLLLELSFIKSEPCQQLSKVLNVLVIRILDNSDKNQSFKVLILILCEFLTPGCNLSSEFAIRHKKIAELVMKCLWKITKNIGILIKENQIDVTQLLLNCHQFLEAVPPIEWKRRSHQSSPFQEELPLKTVKTIMREVTRCLGKDIFFHMNNIPYPDQSYAVSYIKQVLKVDK